MDPWWLSNARPKIFVFWVNIKFIPSLEKLDLHLPLSRENPHAVGRQPDLPASPISCILGRKPNAQLLEFNHPSRLNHSFSIISNSTLTQHLDILGTWKWNQTRRCGGRYRVERHCLSRSRPEWVKPRIKSGIFMLRNIVASSTTSSPSETVDQVHSI